MPLWLVWVICPVLSPPSLMLAQFIHWMVAECTIADTVQQYLKLGLVRNAKHGTRSSAMQKFNSVPAEISAHVKAVSILGAKKVSQGHPESHNSGKQHQISTQEQPA